MSWFLLAIIGHVSNGIAFVIDKALLASTFKKSATYAGFISGLSIVTIVALPWVRVWPEFSLWPALFGFGLLFVFGLWSFFEALSKSEATRVVPLVGALVPLFTVFESFVLFDEHLTRLQLIGIGGLIFATYLLTLGTTAKKPRSSIVGLCILTGFLFASATLCGKYAFEHGDFFSVLVTSRIIAGIGGILIIISQPAVRTEIAAALWPKKSKQQISFFMRTGPILGQICGAIGFVLIHIAIRSGSVSIVNALQAVQYAVLVIAALILRKFAPKLLGEDLTRRVLTIKISALIVTALGLYLVA